MEKMLIFLASILNIEKSSDKNCEKDVLRVWFG